MARSITDLFLYKHRFLFGHLLITTTIIGVFVITWLFVPGGISNSEMAASLQSHALSIAHFNPQMIVDLPFHLLQRLSFEVFGVSVLSMKLPSLLLGIGTTLGLYILLRHWFRESITIPTVLIAVTMTQFLFMVQQATPLIFFQFVSVWVLVFATLLAWKRKPTILWALLLCFSIGLSLYTPLGIYLPLTLAVLALAHPRVRYLLLRLPRAKTAGALAIVLVMAAPIIYAGIKDPSVPLKLLGIPSSMPNIRENLMQLAQNLFGFWGTPNGEMITPLFSLSIVFLIFIGLYRLAHVHYTARSYITWIWLIILLPLVVLNPVYATVLFIPTTLLIVRALSQLLLHSWYKLFPRNPYARITGALLLIVLVFAIMISHIFHYVYAYTYSPQLAHHYHKDLTILDHELKTYQYKQVALLTQPEQRDFYRMAAHYNKQFTVVNSVDEASSATTLIVNRQAHATYAPDSPPDKILTSSLATDADLFYIYNTDKKNP